MCDALYFQRKSALVFRVLYFVSCALLLSQKSHNIALNHVSEQDESGRHAEEHDPEAGSDEYGPEHSQYGSIRCRLGDDERRRTSRKHRVDLTGTGADAGFVPTLTEDRHLLTGVESTFDVSAVVSDVQFDDFQVPRPLFGVDVVGPFDKVLNPVRWWVAPIDFYPCALVETESNAGRVDEDTA